MPQKKPDKKETQFQKAKRLIRRVFGVGSSDIGGRPADKFAGNPESVAGKLKAQREQRKKMLDEI